MWTVIDAAGGVALLIFAVRFLRKGLDRLVGDRIDRWSDRLTGGRIRAAAFGFLLSLVMPSSTSLSLLSVGQVRQNKMSGEGALALLLGGCVGMTVLVYLVAFDMRAGAALLVLVGVTMFQGMRRERLRGIGQVLFSLGILLVGAGWLKTAATQASAWPDLQTIITVMTHYPFLAMVLGAVLTVMFQSSTASVATMMSLDGLLHPSLAIPLLIGANIGVAITTVIVGWNDPHTRRLGWGLLTIRLGVGVCLLLIAELPPVAAWVEGLGIPLPQLLAVAHTGFNVVAMAAGLALLGPVVRMVDRIVPSGATADEFRPEYLDKRWADEPQIAFTQSKREIARMASMVGHMLDKFWLALKSTDVTLARNLSHHDDHVDRLNRAIKYFLTREITEVLNPRQEATRVAQLRFLSALETVGDIIEGDLADIAIKKISRGLDFSPQGWEELEKFFRQVSENLEIATAAFVDSDASLARKLLRHEVSIRDQEQNLAVRHFERLQTGQRMTIETTDLHLELLTHLKHINHLMAGVAYGVLETAEGDPTVLAEVRAAG